MVEIREVATNAQLSAFIKFPDKLYKDNPYRATPPHVFERNVLSKKKNPAFEHCQAKYWLAYRDGEVVGRIAGIINHKFVDTWGERKGRFGWVDFIDDYEVSSKLLETAEQWVVSMGMDGIQGPLGFTDMDFEGMLVEGFDEVATMAVIYNYPYYPVHMEHHGYVKDVDWVQKELKVPGKVPERLVKFSKIVQEKYNVRPLKVKKAKELIPYAKSMFYTLNESFKHLYGFVPLTDKQIEHYTREYFSIIIPRYVCLVVNEKDEVIAFGISMPSLSEALMKARGNLVPRGIYHIYKALRKHDIIDMYLNAVRPDYQNKGIHSIYYSQMMQAYIDSGITYAITNPQLEGNNRALVLWEGFEQREHLRRRCYVKTLK